VFQFFSVLICSVGSALFPQWPRAFRSSAWVAQTRTQGPTESVWSTGVKRSECGSQQALSGAMAPGGSSPANLTPHICPITEPAIKLALTARPVKYCYCPTLNTVWSKYTLPHAVSFSNFDIYVGVPSCIDAADAHISLCSGFLRHKKWGGRGFKGNGNH